MHQKIGVGSHVHVLGTPAVPGWLDPAGVARGEAVAALERRREVCAAPGPQQEERERGGERRALCVADREPAVGRIGLQPGELGQRCVKVLVLVVEPAGKVGVVQVVEDDEWKFSFSR